MSEFETPPPPAPEESAGGTGCEALVDQPGESVPPCIRDAVRAARVPPWLRVLVEEDVYDTLIDHCSHHAAPQSLSPWLAAVARRASLRMLRRARSLASLDRVPESALACSERATTEDSAAARRRAKVRLMACGASESCQRVVSAAFSCRKWKKFATCLGMDERNARRALARAGRSLGAIDVTAERANGAAG